jgi:hypothetical protein
MTISLMDTFGSSCSRCLLTLSLLSPRRGLLLQHNYGLSRRRRLFTLLALAGRCATRLLKSQKLLLLEGSGKIKAVRLLLAAPGGTGGCRLAEDRSRLGVTSTLRYPTSQKPKCSAANRKDSVVEVLLHGQRVSKHPHYLCDALGLLSLRGSYNPHPRLQGLGFLRYLLLGKWKLFVRLIPVRAFGVICWSWIAVRSQLASSESALTGLDEGTPFFTWKLHSTAATPKARCFQVSTASSTDAVHKTEFCSRHPVIS